MKRFISGAIAGIRHLRPAEVVWLVVGLGLSFVLSESGCVARSDNTALDSYLALRADRPVDEIVVVEISNDDYAKLFKSTSPLDQQVLGELIQGIQAGKPSLTVVDIDTSLPITAPALDSVGCAPPIVWAQNALTEEGEEGGEGKGGGERQEGEEGRVKPSPFASKGHVAAPCSSGLALFPQDSDGVVRRYRRVVNAEGQSLPTLPWAAACHLTPERCQHADSGSHGDLILNFSGDRYAFTTFHAKQILAGREGASWATDGPLVGRTVVLGGSFRESRDRYITPVGEMPGVQLIAHALAAEIHHGGITEEKERVKLGVELLVGILVLLIHHRWRPATATVISVVTLPLGALAGSWLVFSTLGRWVAFTPLVACVLFDQVVHHLREYGRLRRQHRKLEEEHRKLQADHSRLSEMLSPTGSLGQHATKTAAAGADMRIERDPGRDSPLQRKRVP